MSFGGSSAPTSDEWDLISGCFARHESSISDSSPCSKASTATSTATSLKSLPTFEGKRRATATTSALPSLGRASSDKARTMTMDLPSMMAAPHKPRAMTMNNLPSAGFSHDFGKFSVNKHSSGFEALDEYSEDSVEAKYNIAEETLGKKGLTGIVRMAERKKTGQIVVVKKSSRSGCSDATWARLRGGTKAHRGLQHPNIVKLEDSQETDTSLIQVTTYLSGSNLASALEQRGRFSEREAISVLRQLLQAVDYLHEQDVIHRDIKLDALMFESPDSDVVKLVDFSSATSWDGIKRLTLRCGTIEHAAPELLQGSYTEKVDMWSVGVVAYMLLTGERLSKARAGQLDLAAAKLECLSSDAQDFILSLLAPRPAQRMSAEEALDHPWLG